MTSQGHTANTFLTHLELWVQAPTPPCSTPSQPMSPPCTASWGIGITFVSVVLFSFVTQEIKKQTQRFREKNYDYQIKKLGRRRDQLGRWDEHLHTNIYKINNQQGNTL